MTSRTRVRRWTPPFGEAVRLAWRPAVAYLVFVALGSLALLLSSAWYAMRGSDDILGLLLGLVVGFAGVVLGQLISLFRIRAMPVLVLSVISVIGAVWVLSFTHFPGGEHLAIALVFFFFAFPCGLLSLMHRWELFASFWPAVGWIGGVFVILNAKGRVVDWEEDKTSIWLPVPLVFLGCFFLLWLFYLSAKQAARVEMWQALSGAAARRITKADAKKARVSAIPRKNLVPLVIVAALLFGAAALLAPFLWRTGKGDYEAETTTQTKTPDKSPQKSPNIDVEGLMQRMQQLANAAKNTLPKLWPLLLLLLLYRPAKRALLLTHLKSPIFPTPPSERIDNLWEYVRIAAEDAGIVPTAADSVEQLMTRIRGDHRSSPALERAAEIYVRTRYGFIVQRGDPAAMRGHATEAAQALRKNLGPWTTVKNLWRPLE